MKTAKLFKNGQSQAVRLPKEFRFEGTEVVAQKVGNGVLLMPKESQWAGFLESLKMFSDDFMMERGQPEVQKRDDFK